MKTVLMVSPNALDGVSYYRHWGPMIELEKQGLVKLIAINNDTEASNWQFYHKAHFAFLNRSSRLIDQVIIEQCLKHGLPMWQDIDDNVFELPKDNPAYDWYTSSSRSILEKALRCAHVVTVATPQLRDYLNEKLNIKSNIISNGLLDNLRFLKKPFKKSNKIVWRGSQAGITDLYYYTKENHIKAHYMGVNPFWFTNSFNPNSHSFGRAKNFIEYINELSDINPAFCFMTHLNDEFHKTKSTNGWIESTLAGAVCLMPEMSEWVDRPGFHYKPLDLEDFQYKFDKMLNSSESKLAEINNNSWKIIENNFLISIINDKRINIINSL